eukprot:TRINITY_DN191_c0_g1_i3.p1 TRINITY_DN191_c0_g1~~TRINITY_DN191_c0_g1_i3.p1  ORF type:complete len:455 (+),score=199.87 TRINITY_DN191_c0_g1_i3:215-1579(+)
MDNITIKLQLLNGQLRRFIVPRNSTFEQFISIITQVAPHARKSLFSYEDDEGDQITISTDIELQEAINNIKLNNCLKLNEKERIKHFKKQQFSPQSPIIENNSNEQVKQQPQQSRQPPIQVERKLVKPKIVLTLKFNNENNENNNRHHNVICDGCECSPIIGIRFRKIGSDYDLCSNCWNKVEQIQEIQSKPVEHKTFFSRHHIKYSAWLGDCHQFIEIQTPINGLTPIEFCVQKIIRKADRHAHKFRMFGQLNNNNNLPHHLPHHFPHHPHHLPHHPHHRHHFHNRCRFPFPSPPHFAHPPMNTDNNDTTNTNNTNNCNNSYEQFFSRRPHCNRFARFNERFINKFEKAYENNDNNNKNDSTNSDDKTNVENNEQSSVPMPMPISNEYVEIENNDINNNNSTSDNLEIDENKKALSLLEEMGFPDNQLNQSLLTQYLGDVNVVIDTLQKLNFN